MYIVQCNGEIMYNLDKKDKLILNELQRDCRQSTRELGHKLETPSTTIHQRIKRLVERGIIKGFSAIINPEKVGLPITAFVLVRRAKRKKFIGEHLADLIAKFPEALEVYPVSGEYDALIKIKGKDEKEIGNWVLKNLWNMPEVERTSTFFGFHESKDSHVLLIK